MHVICVCVAVRTVHEAVPTLTPTTNVLSPKLDPAMVSVTWPAVGSSPGVNVLLRMGDEYANVPELTAVCPPTTTEICLPTPVPMATWHTSCACV